MRQHLGSLDGNTLDAPPDRAANPLAEFGQRSARMLIADASSEADLRKVLAKIDPTLWDRTKKIDAQLRSRGARPAVALESALAQAMSSGLVTEVLKVGVATSAAMNGTLGATEAAACMNPPTGYTWASGGIPGSDHWERVRAGVAPVPNPTAGCYAIGTRVIAAGSAVKTTPVAPTTPARMIQVGPWQFPADAERYVMGPTVRDHRTGNNVSPWQAIPPAWRHAIGQAGWELFKGGFGSLNHPDIIRYGTSVVPAAALGLPPGDFRPLVSPGSGIAYKIATRDAAMRARYGYLLEAGWIPLRYFPVMREGKVMPSIPIFKVMHPTKNKMYGVYMRSSSVTAPLGIEVPPPGGVVSATNMTPAQASGDQPGFGRTHFHAFKSGTPRVLGPLVFEWAPIPPPEEASWWDKLVDFIVSIPSKIVEAAKAVVGAIKDLACDVLSSGVGQAAIVGAGAAYGVPPQVGAIGVKVVSDAGCSKPADETPAVVPPPPPGSGTSTLLLLAGGAAVIGLLLFASKKT